MMLEWVNSGAYAYAGADSRKDDASDIVKLDQ